MYLLRVKDPIEGFVSPNALYRCCTSKKSTCDLRQQNDVRPFQATLLLHSRGVEESPDRDFFRQRCRREAVSCHASVVECGRRLDQMLTGLAVLDASST